jgi:inorganic pyrophosphatase
MAIRSIFCSLMDEATFSGSLVEARIISVLEAEQFDHKAWKRNDRLLGIVMESRENRKMKTIQDLGAMRLKEIEHCFVAYNEVEGRSFGF